MNQFSREQVFLRMSAGCREATCEREAQQECDLLCLRREVCDGGHVHSCVPQTVLISLPHLSTSGGLRERENYTGRMLIMMLTLALVKCVIVSQFLSVKYDQIMLCNFVLHGGEMVRMKIII